MKINSSAPAEGLTLKSLYFFYNLAMPIYFIYINLYYSRLGFTGSQIGLLNSLYYLVNFVAQPIWGYISDTYRARKPVLIIMAALGASIVGLNLTTSVYSRIILIVMAFGTCFNAMMPILDATVMDYTQRTGQNYGSIRLWGSVGFVTAGLVAGRLTAMFGLRVIFAAVAVVLLLQFITTWRLPGGHRQLETSAAPPAGNNLQQIGKLLSNSRFFVFLLGAFLAQASMAAGFAFLNIYMAQTGASDSFIGMAWSVAGLSEIVAFAMLGFFLRKLGARRLLLVSFTVLTIRWLLYFGVRTPWLFLPVQLLQGFSAGFFFAGGVTYVQEEAPENLKTTGQTIFGAVNMGLGPIAGMAIGGRLADLVGLPGLFLCSAAVSGLAALLFVFAAPTAKRQRAILTE